MGSNMGSKEIGFENLVRIQHALGRIRRRASVNAIVNYRVPWKPDKFLKSCPTNVSRRALLLSVNSYRVLLWCVSILTLANSQPIWMDFKTRQLMIHKLRTISKYVNFSFGLSKSCFNDSLMLNLGNICSWNEAVKWPNRTHQNACCVVYTTGQRK